MKVLCRHGHFAFYPRDAGEIFRFCDYFDLEQFKRVGDYFTFPALAEVENYSLLGKKILNLPAIKTCAGHPWEVMAMNGYVYHIASESILPKSTIAGRAALFSVGDYFLSETPLIQPGSRIDSTGQILSYSGTFVEGYSELHVSEFSYE